MDFMDYQVRKQAWLDSSWVSKEDKDYIQKQDTDTLEEMFGQNLAFGTAGMRALLGPGCGRLNLLTVRRATIGVGLFLISKYGEAEAKKRGVAISFDNRHYSKEFRDMAGQVLTDMGIKVYTFNDPHPTPELSFTVRKFGCVGGLMITASHNPKQYNGYKFYDEKGCQGVYDTIDGLIAIIDKLPDELTVTYSKVPEAEKGTVTYLDQDNSYDEAYVAKEVTTSLYKDVYQGERLTKIVFTPECGCDCKVGPMALRSAGYTVTTVPNQDFFDPDFKGTENPNPETDGAYKGAIQTLKDLNAKGEKYNLILVTDPDADRCGIAFIDKNGQIRRYTGNQTGALLIDYVLTTLKKRNQLPATGVICNTFVTGGQGAKVAELFNVKVRTTAIGFKYIGNMADKIESLGEKYLFGYEESYGYLLADFVRDKDSLQSIVAIADMTEYYLRQGKTLDVAYAELSKKTGRYYNDQVSVAFEGAGSLERMNAELTKLRNNPPKAIAGAPVKTLYDYQLRKISQLGDGTSEPLTDPDIDTTNCLRFNLDDGFIAIRPSGTEPKVKFYFEITNLADEDAHALMLKRADFLKKLMGL
jgi:phosphoglucomutase